MREGNDQVGDPDMGMGMDMDMLTGMDTLLLTITLYLDKITRFMGEGMLP